MHYRAPRSRRYKKVLYSASKSKKAAESFYRFVVNHGPRSVSRSYRSRVGRAHLKRDGVKFWFLTATKKKASIPSQARFVVFQLEGTSSKRLVVLPKSYRTAGNIIKAILPAITYRSGVEFRRSERSQQRTAKATMLRTRRATARLKIRKEKTSRVAFSKKYQRNAIIDSITYTLSKAVKLDFTTQDTLIKRLTKNMLLQAKKIGLSKLRSKKFRIRINAFGRHYSRRGVEDLGFGSPWFDIESKKDAVEFIKLNNELFQYRLTSPDGYFKTMHPSDSFHVYGWTFEVMDDL